MYLQFACNVTAMGNDSMNGEVEFVGDGFVGHALHNAGDDFFSRWLRVSCSLSFPLPPRCAASG